MYYFFGVIGKIGNTNHPRANRIGVTFGNNMLPEIIQTPDIYFELSSGTSASQSMEDGDETVFLADAWVYNYEEVAKKINDRQSINVERSHAALLIDAYKKWGQDCVYHLHGEFVLVCWNKSEQKLSVITDRLGLKPFFYYNDSDCFIFSNRFNAVEPYNRGENVFDPECLIEYHFIQGEPLATYNQSIKNLCGAVILNKERGLISIKRYWHLESAGKYKFIKDSDWYDCLREMIINAVANHLDKGDKVGLFLSGGLDSGAIACLLAPLLKKRNRSLYAFSSVLSPGYSGPNTDEKKYIRHVLEEHDNVECTYVDVPEAGPFTAIEKYFDIDECIPTHQHYMDHAILQMAQREGINNMYLGWGGDICISVPGNGVLMKLIHRFQWADAIRIARKFAKIYNLSFKHVFKHQYLDHLLIYANYADSKQKKYLQSGLKKEVFNANTFVNTRTAMNGVIPHVNNGRIGKLAQKLQTRALYYGMQTSLPLIDADILEFMMDVPERLLVESGFKRSLFRRAMEGILPVEIQWRKSKSPFVPNCAERVLREKRHLESGLVEIRKDQDFKKFYDIEIIQDKFAQVFANPDKHASSPALPLPLSQNFLVFEVISILKKRNYKF